MKKLLLLLLIALSAWPTGAQDFTYEYEGQTITYTILDADAKTCSTKAGTTSPYAAGNEISGDLILPAKPMDGDTEYTLVQIPLCGFYKSSLTSIIIPSTVTEIGNFAFYNSPDLTNISIKGEVASIGNQTFAYCRKLEQLSFGGNITSFGTNIFSNCDALTRAIFEDGVTTIPDNLFRAISTLKSVVLPTGLTTIGKNVFYESGLESIAIPSSVTNIGGFAFGRCESLTSVVICGGEVEIGQYAFNGSTNIQKAAYPETLTENTPSAKLLISTPPQLQN